MQSHHRTLHRALVCVVKWGLVSRNVCDATEPPKERHVEMTTWTPSECARFLETVRTNGNRYYPLFLAAIFTGLRQGELLGLRCTYVDLEVGTVMVQQILEGAGAEPWFGTPKTAKSRRTVPIPGRLVSALRSWEATQNIEWLALGTDYRDFGLDYRGRRPGE